jgi:uncharacterized protein YpmS
MTKTQRMGWLSALLILLFFSSLACNLPGRSTQEPTELPTIPVTTQAVETLQSEIDAAEEALRNNQTVEIQVSEAQLTSAAAFELQSDPDIPLADPQIYLRDGQVTILANLTQNQIEVPVEIILELSANGQGNLEYQVISGQIGPLPVPDSLMDQLTSRLDQIIANQTAVNDSPFFIESITIGDGYMTLRGYKR